MPRNSSEKQYVSGAELAAIVGCSRTTVHKYTQEGKIPGAERLGRAWVYVLALARKWRPARQQAKGRRKRGAR